MRKYPTTNDSLQVAYAWRLIAVLSGGVGVWFKTPERLRLASCPATVAGVLFPEARMARQYAVPVALRTDSFMGLGGLARMGCSVLPACGWEIRQIDCNLFHPTAATTA